MRPLHLPQDRLVMENAGRAQAVEYVCTVPLLFTDGETEAWAKRVAKATA